MTIIAFAGPSLPQAARAPFPGVEWRPPAEAGDLLRLKGGPRLTICLIDGYFDHRPAVRHKEILLLLAKGTRIFGASSIGALRAAEMDGFGMIGVGEIYRAYARGTIAGDDEVALIHASADSEWKPLSLPLVDVRATLCRALRERILSRKGAEALLYAARAIHYVERSWQSMLALLGHSPAFEAWVGAGQVEQKKRDALRCLRAALNDDGAAFPRPPMVATAFIRALATECGIDLESRNKEAQDGGDAAGGKA